MIFVSESLRIGVRLSPFADGWQNPFLPPGPGLLFGGVGLVSVATFLLKAATHKKPFLELDLTAGRKRGGQGKVAEAAHRVRHEMSP